MEALLALEDGRTFRGRSFGAVAERCGEIVFNTALTGYQEVLTDPSYRGQIVVMTTTEIGNTGTNDQDGESARPQVEGFVVRECSIWPSSWRATQGLAQYLREHGVPGISEIDTRALTRHLRSRGSMRAVLSAIDRDAESLVAKARGAPELARQDLVQAVSCGSAYRWTAGRVWPAPDGPAAPTRRLRLAAVDFGVKRQSLRLLVECGFDVTVFPAATPADELLAFDPAACFLSNGPGDPALLTGAVRTVAALIGRVPVLGICLGQQLAGLALGGRTEKLKFGHHGTNHPVRDERTGNVAVTSQNHGYTVDAATLPRGVEVTHVSLNDGSCEGFAWPAAQLMAVQFHPEAAPGPHDTRHVFHEFRSLIDAARIHVPTALEAGS